MIEFTFDDELIQSQMQRLAQVPWAVQKALSPAVSETMRHAKESLTDRLQSEIPLPPRLVAQSIRVIPLTMNSQGAECGLRVASKALPLIEFDVEPLQITARKGQRPKQWPGFSYALRQGDRREREELVGTYTSGLPFIAKMHNAKSSQQGGSGHLGVYWRTGKGQLKEVYGPHIQFYATTPQVENMLMTEAENNFASILPRIVDSVLAEHGLQA